MKSFTLINGFGFEVVSKNLTISVNCDLGKDDQTWQTVENKPFSKYMLLNDRGVRLMFENGYILSIMFHPVRNYCDSTPIQGGVESENAELAIWKDNGKDTSKFLTRGVCTAIGLPVNDDAVLPRVDSDTVVLLIDFLKNLKSGSIMDFHIQNIPEYGWNNTIESLKEYEEKEYPKP